MELRSVNSTRTTLTTGGEAIGLIMTRPVYIILGFCVCGVYSFGSPGAEAALLTWTVELAWVLQLPRTGERRVNRDQEGRLKYAADM